MNSRIYRLSPGVKCVKDIAVRSASSTAQVPYKIPDGQAPPYPYGPTLRYQRANTGLYGGSTIQFGNMVSKKNEHKSRRVWIPNVHRKKFWSPYLGRFVQVKVNLRVMRTIDKLGGLDEYLIGSDSPARIKELGVVGWELRWKVMQTEAYKERVKRERKQLGLPPQGWQAAEKERRREEKRAAFAAAEVHIDALDAQKKRTREARNLIGSGDHNVEEIETGATQPSTIESIQEEQVLKDQSAMVEAHIQQDPMAAHESGPTSTELPPLEQEQNSVLESSSAVAVSLADLEAHALRMRTTPDALIKQARTLRRARAPHEAHRAARDAEIEAKRAQYVSEIETALTSTIHPAPVAMFEKYLKIRRKEINAERKQQGLRQLTERNLEKIHQPPREIPEEDWRRLERRVNEIKAAWETKKELKREQEKLKAEAQANTQAEAEDGGERDKPTTTPEKVEGEVKTTTKADT